MNNLIVDNIPMANNADIHNGKNTNPTEVHITPKQPEPVRLQEYGVGIFSTIPTKSALKKALKKRLIKVNDVIATTATFIHGGERISLYVPDVPDHRKKLVFPLQVLFEDDYLAVIHKPAGILVSGNSFKTIAHALSQNLTESNQPDATIPQPVHRLDYATTGILLAGKTNSGIRALNTIFEQRAIKKTYYAATIGKMDNEGQITTDIDGKNSHSIYTLKKTVTSERFGNLNLVQLEPKTGRRHQLRKHLSSIGNPILGDKEYGIEGLILNGKGLYLHAYSLQFTHPFTNEELHFKDDLPERFKKIFGQIQEPFY